MRHAPLFLDLLDSSEGLGSFAPAESAPHGRWRWSLGSESTIEIPSAEAFQLRFTITSAQRARVFADDQEIATLDGPGAHRLNLAPGTSAVRFVPERWALAPGDLRPLALCFTELSLLRRSLAEGRICPMPFTRKEIRGSGPFVPCCSPWLTPDYFALERGDDDWNGPQAQALRESILGGSYRYCRRELCHTEYVPFDELARLRDPRGEFYLTEANLAATRVASLTLPDGPTDAVITADTRCNLACPSCRTEKITTLRTPADSARVDSAARELTAMEPHARRLRIAGDGEPLFSPFLRETIRTLDRYPHLEIVELHTNGLLLDEKTFRDLAPGSARINRVFVSIDAAGEETYRATRGGDWARLRKNLAWTGDLRRAGRFESFTLLFVYQSCNFREMPEFVALAREMGADQACFSPLLPWERAEMGEYEERAVHLPGHPEHEEFREIAEKLRSDPIALLK